MTASLDASPERHSWTLSGHRVTQIAADLKSARIQSWALDASLELRLGAEFVLRLADGTERRVDPDYPEQLAPLLTLLNRVIDALVVTRRGELEVSFSDGTEIRIGSHPKLEAFEVQGGGALEGMTYVALPGGGTPWLSGRG
jgi:hypothetical protein